MKTRFQRADAGGARTKLLVWGAAVLVLGMLPLLVVSSPKDGLTSARMTQVLANMRALQLATTAVTTDTLATGKDGLVWTSMRENGKLRPATLAEFFGALTNNDAYLSKSDLRKLLTAPGFPRRDDNVPLTAENIPFRIFWVDDQSPKDQPLFVTRNWQDGHLTDAEPFGRKGFFFYTRGDGRGMKKAPKDAGDSNDFPKGQDAEGRTYRYVELR